MQLFTVKELAPIVGMPESSLAHFLKEDEKKRFFGGIGLPALYPEESIPLFRALKQLRDEKILKPQNWWELRHLITERAGQNPISISGSGALTLPETQNLFLNFGPQDLTAIVQQAIRQGVAEALEEHHRRNPPTEPPEELLTSAQAATLLKCSPRSIRCTTGLLPARKGRQNLYLMSEIQDYLRSLRHRPDQPQIPPPPDPNRPD